MKKTILAMILTTLIWTISGCASGPLGQWFRGSPCNTCNPPMQNPDCGINVANPCDDGCNTSSGIFDWFRRRTNPAPASIPANSFQADPGVPYYNTAPINEFPVETFPGVSQNSAAPGTIGPETYLPSPTEVVPSSELYGSEISGGLGNGATPTFSPAGF